jgi:sporulation protein YlmC with PRC-barrel domain
VAPDEIGMIALGNSGLMLAHGEDDVRGMAVLDPEGHRVGEVDEIIIDEEERRARLLVVTSGGILGLAKDKRLVPVDAVAGVDHDIHLHHTHDVVWSGSEYDPELADRPDYSGAYGHFGYTPFWGMGYTAPPFLDRR